MKLKPILLVISTFFLASILLITLLDREHSQHENVPVEVMLRIMETTDVHMYLANYDYFAEQSDDSIGFVNTASLIRKARKQVENSVLIDNGDLIQNSPLGDYEATVRRTAILNGDTHVAFKAMNLLGYDVGNIGNHEFNFGLDFLDATLSGANFPYVNANVYDVKTNKHRYTPYVIQSKQVFDQKGISHTLKIGYIGFTPPQILQWDKDKLEGQVTVADIVTTAKQLVPEMKLQGADIIIAIPHSGLTVPEHEEYAANTALELSKVKDIDAILFGHSHRLFPGDKTYDNLQNWGLDNEKGLLNGVPAVMPGFFGNHLGIIDLTLNRSSSKWVVKDAKVEVRAISSGSVRKGNFEKLAAVDKPVFDAIRQQHEATIDWINESYAVLDSPINSFFSLIQDDPTVQIVADAQRDWGNRFVRGTELEGLPILSAAAPFRAGRNGPADYTQIKKGEFTQLDTVSLYVFPNTIRMIKLSGQDVKEWLERSAGQFNQIDPQVSTEQAILNEAFPSFDFDVIDGVSYKIDVTQPARYDLDGKLIDAKNERIVDLQYQQKPIDLSQTFLVVTNNYRATGGGHFPNIDGVLRETFEGPDENRGVLRSYINKQSRKSLSGVFSVKPDRNWQLKKIDSNVPLNVTYRTSPNQNTYKPIRIDKNGYAIVRLDIQTEPK